MSDEHTRWELRKGGAVLGTLTAYGWQYPWLDCDFDATDAFDDYRDLFVGEFRLLDASEREVADWEWENAYRKIIASGIAFVPVNDPAFDLRDHLIDAEGDIADWLRPILGA
jgi:hypothetical protein